MKKNLLVEVNRMREIMGLSLLNEQASAATKKVLRSMGYSDEAIEALVKSGIDFSDLTKLADDFNTLGIKNMDEWQSSLAARGVDLTTATDSQILKLVDQNPALKSALSRAYQKAVSQATEELIKNMTLPAAVMTQFQTLATKQLTKDNSAIIAQLYERQVQKIDDLIDNLVSGGNTVPDELLNLKKLSLAKQAEAENFGKTVDSGTSAPGGFKPDPGGVKVDNPQIPGNKYQVGTDPEFDSAFDLGLSSAPFKLTDTQTDQLRQVLYNIYKQGDLTLTQFYKQFEELGQKLAKSSDERTASFGRKILNLLKKVASTCGKDLKVTIKTLYIAPSCALGFWGLLSALSLTGDIIGLDNNFWKGMPCAIGSIFEGAFGDGELEGFWKDMCDGGGKFWESDKTSKEPTIEDAKNWISTLNGVGQDLEGLSVTGFAADSSGKKNEYVATLSDGRAQKLLWDPNTKKFTPQ
jgi:hypothetical protein